MALCKKPFLRKCLLTLNIVVCCLSSVVLAIGLVLLLSSYQYDFLDFLLPVTVAGGVHIALAPYFLFSGILGYLSVRKQSRSIIVKYLWYMFLLLTFEAGALAAFLLSYEIQDGSTAYLSQQITLSNQRDVDADLFLNRVQGNLECCGVYSFEDYVGGVPMSCYENGDPYLMQPFSTGCSLAMFRHFKTLCLISALIDCAILEFQVAIFWMSVSLSKAIKRDEMDKNSDIVEVAPLRENNNPPDTSDQQLPEKPSADQPQSA